MIINQIVKGSGGGSAPLSLVYTDNAGVITKASTPIDFTGATTLSGGTLGYTFSYAFYGSSMTQTTVDMSQITSITGLFTCNHMYSRTNITSVDLSSLSEVGASDSSGSSSYACSQMFAICGSLVDIDLSGLTTVRGSRTMSFCFDRCTSLPSINLSSLSTIEADYGFEKSFYGCTSLASANFNSLTRASIYCFAQAFNGCTSLTSVSFPALSSLLQRAFEYAFANCTSLSTLYFGGLTTTSFGSATNQFNGMLSGVTGCTVHFPAAIQGTIGSWSDVTAGFDGTNTTVLFDL